MVDIELMIKLGGRSSHDSDWLNYVSPVHTLRPGHLEPRLGRLLTFASHGFRG